MRSRSITYKKNLILLCDNYPLSAGEFFIDDEMRVIAPWFEKVILYTASAKSNENLNRFIPDNGEIVQFSKQKLEFGKIKSFFRIFKPMFLRELAFAVHKLPMKYWGSAFKIMYVDIHRATNLKNELLQFCDRSHLNVSNCVFYSYWHDYKALALAMLRKSSGCACVARAHRWDVFADKNTIPYLPFKRFILNNLSKTISISKAGKEYFNAYVENCDDKVVVSFLGKINERKPVTERRCDEVLICSCSNLIPVKQVDRIIEAISQLEINNLRWIHFGDVPLRAELEAMAKKLLPKVHYEFRGIVPNNEILDFYASQYVDLFINLSSSEGIPVSIMEALSAGIPVVTTNVGGTGEAVNNTNGFLVSAEFNTDEVVQIIINYLNSDSVQWQQYRQNAYDFWRENFEAGKNYEEFYKL
ncbi:MAG: glycosyltransferase, partial [Bacteroidales bacterium]|nr:glycosyltransferase [Bacteroidales bacterium]